MGRALGFSSFAAFPVCPIAASPVEGWLRAVPLDVPPLLALKALFRF